MDISLSRAHCIESTLSVLQTLQIPFLYFFEGVVRPLENAIGDDMGMYYMIPKLAVWLGVSWQQALVGWNAGFTFAGILIAVAAFWLLGKAYFERIVATFGVIGVGMACWSIGDVYIAPFVATSLLPWLFVVVKRSTPLALGSYFFSVGMFGSFSNFIRTHSAFALWATSVVVLVLQVRSTTRRALSLVCLLGGIASFNGWFTYEMFQRNQYLNKQGVVYGTHALGHVFWHSIYAGFGFLMNPYGIAFSDSCMLIHAREVDPEVVYCSVAYNELLKKETIKLCKEHPQFVMRTLFAKAGVLFYYLLLFANFGLLCAWFYRKPWYVELAYVLALFLSALPGLATIPVAPYLTGFFAVATFYGVHSIVWALQHGLLRDLRFLLRRFF